jgi:HEPN domain-containing protein
MSSTKDARPRFVGVVVLALADRSADWVDQALRDLEQAEQSMQEWQPAPPEGLEDRLRLLDGFNISTRYPDSYPEGTPGEHHCCAEA